MYFEVSTPQGTPRGSEVFGTRHPHDCPFVSSVFFLQEEMQLELGPPPSAGTAWIGLERLAPQSPKFRLPHYSVFLMVSAENRINVEI